MSKDCNENRVIGEVYAQIHEQIDPNLITALIDAMGGLTAVQQLQQDYDKLSEAVQSAATQLGMDAVSNDVIIAVVQRVQQGGVDPAGTQQPYQQ